MITLSHQADFSAAHTEPLLPAWHECHYAHEHEWAVILKVESEHDLTQDESVCIHTAFAQFDGWVEETLNHRYLNEALGERCGPYDLARWVYNVWSDRLPHLTTVRASGPARSVLTQQGMPRYQRYEVSYP